MVFPSGSLHAGVDCPGRQVYALNTATGQGTLVTSETGPLLGLGGLAPGSSSPQAVSPEPLQILQTDLAKYQLVDDELTRIDYGVFA